MFYLSKLANKVAIYKNLIYLTNMKRSSPEGKKKEAQSSDEDFEDGS